MTRSGLRSTGRVMILMRKVSPKSSSLVTRRRLWKALMAGAWLKYRERAVIGIRYCNHNTWKGTLHTKHCTLHMAHCTLHTTLNIPETAHCTLNTK